MLALPLASVAALAAVSLTTAMVLFAYSRRYRGATDTTTATASTTTIAAA